MSWEELHRIQELESKVRHLEDRLAALEANQPKPWLAWYLETVEQASAQARQVPEPMTRGDRNDV